MTTAWRTQSEMPVNWCPGLGTVLANEEVTAEGRSDIGNYPVFKRNMRQWVMRITAYSDRLLGRPRPAGLARADQGDAAQLDRSVHRSAGAVHRAHPTAGEAPIEVFTTRPDTLFGATFMVLAPEHPLVDALVPRRMARGHPRSALDRQAEVASRPRRRSRPYPPTRSRCEQVRRRTPGRGRRRPASSPAPRDEPGQRRADVPVFIADYVLMGYGTGAIMAVPAEDERDWDFARDFDLPTPPSARSNGSAERPLDTTAGHGVHR
jgi:leucyl-tRNA synthetase